MKKTYCEWWDTWQEEVDQRQIERCRELGMTCEGCTERTEKEKEKEKEKEGKE